MRKRFSFLLFLFMPLMFMASPVDSVKSKHWKVSVIVNANGGYVSSPIPSYYGEKNSGMIHRFPYDIRCIFIKNRVGIIYSSLGHSGSKFFPFQKTKDPYNQLKAEQAMFVVYNISPASFNFKRGGLYIQIANGIKMGEDKRLMLLLSAGGFIKINSALGFNISGTITKNLTSYNNNFYNTLYASAGLFFKLFSNDSLPKEKIQENGFYAELGGDFNSVKRHELISGDGQYYSAYNIDTTHIIQSDLSLNQTFTPLFVLGYKLKSHSLAVEGMYQTSDFLSFYSTPNINFSSAEVHSKNLKVGFEYNYDFSFLRSKKIRDKKYNFFAGIKIKQEFRNNKIEMDYAREFRDDEMLRSEFKSSITRFLPVLGLKIKCNERLYIKSGLDINSLGYITGLYEWEKTIIPDFWPKTYAEGEKAYNKTLYGGESSSFALIDNFFLRIGYSF
jgi:hypothetical protein